MDLNQALENLKFDIRMRDWNLKQGLIKNEDWDSYLKSLTDSSSASEPVTLEDREDWA